MWKKEFVELLFSSDQTKINAIEAAKLKYDKFPSFLYRFRSFDDDYSLESLKQDKIYLSDPSVFNDPYDCAFMLTNFKVDNQLINSVIEDDPDGFRKYYGITPRQLSNLKRSNDVIRDLTRIFAKKSHPEHKKNPKKLRDISKDFNEKFRKMKLDINKLKGNLRVSCFTEDYKSILMWSHYAEDHTGFCVKYDFKSLGHNHHLTRNLFPVIYTNEVFPVDDYVYQSMYSKDATFKNVLSSYMRGIDLRQINVKGGPVQLNNEKTKFNNMFYVYAALNKFKGWEYEKEWRYVITYKKELKSRFIEVPQPSAIYLGAKSDENKDSILKIAEDKNIDVYQMQMESKEFALEPKKIL